MFGEAVQQINALVINSMDVKGDPMEIITSTL